MIFGSFSSMVHILSSRCLTLARHDHNPHVLCISAKAAEALRTWAGSQALLQVNGVWGCWALYRGKIRQDSKKLCFGRLCFRTRTRVYVVHVCLRNILWDVHSSGCRGASCRKPTYTKSQQELIRGLYHSPRWHFQAGEGFQRQATPQRSVLGS